jgi:hypothetical protein
MKIKLKYAYGVSKTMSNKTMTSATLDPQGGVARAKVLYHADHQERFLSLQAETETLLNQLQAMKAQRLADPTVNSYHNV